MFGKDSKVVVLKKSSFKSGTAQLKNKKSGLGLIYSTTCPYCVMVKEEWGKLSKMPGMTAFAFQTNHPDHEEIVMKLSKDTGFQYVPTIVVVKDGKFTKTLYQGERTAAEMAKFAKSKLGSSKPKKSAPKKKAKKTVKKATKKVQKRKKTVLKKKPVKRMTKKVGGAKKKGKVVRRTMRVSI